MDPLKVDQRPVTDERISKIEYHSHRPYTASYKNGDEVRILIQNQDLYVKPSDSFLIVDIEVKKTAANYGADFWIYSNGFMFLFDDIRYEINGVEIDRCKNVGMTTLMKGLTTWKMYKNEGWIAQELVKDVAFKGIFEKSNGHLQLSICLNELFGFCEDYKRLVLNARHELIIKIAQDFSRVGNVVVGEEFHVRNIELHMPNYYLNDREKIQMLKILDSGKYLTMPFRSWELFEMPHMAKTTKFNWSIKTSSSMERPRYVIFGMQTGRNKPKNKDSSLFDHCKLRNFKLYLNSESYPYESLNLDFSKQHAAVLYKMYLDFKRSYYGSDDQGDSYIGGFTFWTHAPLVYIDVSRQNESIKSSAIDVKLEFELHANVPDDTRAFCLLIHDRIVEYSPLTNITRHLV